MSYIFDGTARRITLLNNSPLNLRDLYSRWIDWVSTSDNIKYPPTFNYIGGDDIDLSAGTTIPMYLYLINNWRIIPFSSSYTLNVNSGILLVEGGGDPFINPIGSYAIRINYSQPVQAISFSTGSGGSSGSGPTTDDISNTLLSSIIDGNVDLKHTLRALLAALTGKTHGVGTDTEVYLSNDGLTPVVTATFDSNNNRTSVNVDIY